jgi:hypothetical protein
MATKKTVDVAAHSRNGHAVKGHTRAVPKTTPRPAMKSELPESPAAPPDIGEAVEQMILSAVALAITGALMYANFALLVGAMAPLAGNLAAAAAAGIICAEAIAGIAHGEGGQAAKLGLLLLAVLCGLEIMLAVIREAAQHAALMQVAVQDAYQHAAQAAKAAAPTIQTGRIGPQAMGAATDGAVMLLQVQAEIADKAAQTAQAATTGSGLEVPAMATGSVALSIGTAVGARKLHGFLNGLRMICFRK